MVGILCEKPSAARNFATAFGGRMKGTYNGEDYVIVAARGHLYEFAPPEDQVDPGLVAKYKDWSLDNLPWKETDIAWKRLRKNNTSSVIQDIKSALSHVDELVIGTDVDPTGEGQLLAWEIIDGIGLRPKKITRMYFMDEAPASIQKAFKERKPLPPMVEDPEYRKSFYRSRWDWLSMQFSRIAKACGDGHTTLRQGRLKSAMVLIVGDGLKALKNYKKIPSYQNKFRDENGVVYSSPEEPTFPTRDMVPSCYDDSPVVLDGTSMKKTAPPKLLDLASLSSILAGKGFKAKEVLGTYQAMYERQYVSYPRTEDKVITPEQFAELLPLVNDIARVVGVDANKLTHRIPRKTHVKTGGAHGANRPGPKVPKDLNELSQFGACAVHIYELLARNYLAMLAEDYEYESQRGHLEKYPAFTGTCSVPKKPGWKAVFNDADDDLDDLNNAGLGKTASPFVHEGFPPKPPQPTMKWLMKQLEKHDVGTGATRTGTYSDMIEGKSPLLVEKRGKLTLSDYGEMSYRLLPGTHIGTLEITEQVQAEMQGIAEGRLDPEECLKKMRRYVEDDIKVMTANGEAMRKELGITMSESTQKEKYECQWNGKPASFSRTFSGHRFTDEECERLEAGEEIEVTDFEGKNGTYGAAGKLAVQEYNGRKYLGFKRTRFLDDGKKPAFSQKEKYTGTWKKKEVSFSREYCGHRFTDEECEALCKGREIEILDCKSKSGSTYGVKGKLANLEFNGHKYVGFERTGFAGDNKGGGRIPKSWCQHVFTEDEIALLEAGKPVVLEGCVSKKGSTFDCKVTYGKNDDGRMGIIPQFS